ncbi:hypothetical protein HH310_15350 [Actinoplanes sp. TBRC 11911]|uniref:hypothetical protein n=1 Tax=Actinoplanes sp. TBRC 11911 TaxID=2729386 RepID=UPI00145E2CB8|nr:hypothetical protein [Actinoplanes sp. TBRC 11911]NMO52564.1 hypothetical protein [Actinoplanes sp. TBRC 11911]
MTVSTARVPTQPRALRPAVPVVPAGHPWRRVVTRAVLVPIVVLLPLITLTPGADHRFNVYSNGGRFAADPLRLPWSVVESLPTYLALGNFRPLGRLVEWSLDVAAFAFTGLLGVPATIGLRVVSFAAAVLMTLAAVLFAESLTGRGRLFAAPPSTFVALLPFAVGAGLVAAGRTSTTVLFGGLYFTSAALVLAVAAWACRARRAGPLVVVAGAALAAFNEIAYLALPLATVAVLIRFYVTRVSLGWRFVTLLWAGFLPVFVPIRVLIYRQCAHGGCYTGSDIAVGGAPATFPQRLVAWLPPLQWERAGLHSAGIIVVLALAVLIVLAVRTPLGGPRGDRRQTLGLVLGAVTILLLGAALAALNADVQHMPWGQGWRESGLTAVAGALLLVAAGRRFPRPALAVLVALAVCSVAANRDFRDASGGGRYPYLHDRIAQEVAGFDPTPDGDARRCALRAAFIRNGADPAQVARLDLSLDRATRQLAGRRFCSEAPR